MIPIRAVAQTLLSAEPRAAPQPILCTKTRLGALLAPVPLPTECGVNRRWFLYLFRSDGVDRLSRGGVLKGLCNDEPITIEKI